MPTFTPTQQIFADETILRHDAHEPDEFLAREEIEADYIAALQPIVNGAPPKHIFLNGTNGTGKTSMTKHLLRILEADCATYDIDVTNIFINCKTGPKGTSSYKLGVKLVNKAREINDGSNYDQLPERGYSESEVYGKLFDELNSIGGVILVVLDEIDELTDESILYQLSRAKSMDKLNKDTHVGIIGISNNPQFLRRLSPDVKDTLTQETILYQPYNSTQLEEILTARAQNAFHDKALDEDVIPLCAGLAVQPTGSARTAIDLLQMAGKLAVRESAETVTTEHVRTANEKIEKDNTKQSLQSLTDQEQLALLSLAEGVADGDEPIPTSEVYRLYRKVCSREEKRSLSKNRFADRLKSLEQQHFVVRELNAKGGRQYRYYLQVDLLVLFETFVPLIKCSETVEEILSNALKNRRVKKADVEDLDGYKG